MPSHPRSLTATLALLLSACGSDATGVQRCSEFMPQGTVIVRGDDPSLVGGAADYPLSYESTVAPTYAVTDLPAPLSGRAMLTSGNNASDDLFLYVKRRVDGLEPNQRYTVSLCVTNATRTREGDLGQGLFLKTGVSALEPDRIESTTGEWLEPYWVMNLDKGNQVQPGPDALNLGYVERPRSEPFGEYDLVTRQAPTVMEVTANADGSAWVFAGVECDYEIPASLYWVELAAAFRPVR